MTRAAFAVLLALAAVRVAAAQEREPEAGLTALHQACLDAGTDGVVLNVAAHPDDESSRTNTILRRKYGLRVVAVYSTYGDGGQNAVGREIGPELAGLRVRETLRAAAVGDVEVRWLGMEDFGYSKTLDETLAVWDRDRFRAALRAVVDAVDPDLVITNHSLAQGHGHHRASFWAIREVLAERAAAGKWVPLLQRCGADGAHVVFDPAEIEPARGETYARLAHRAWTQHVTQGPWGPHNPLHVGKDHWRLANLAAHEDPREALAALRAAEPALRPWQRDRAPGLERLAADVARRPPAEARAEVRRVLDLTQRAYDAEWQRLLGSKSRDRTVLDALLRRRDALQRALLALAGVRTETWLERDDVPVGGKGKAFVVVHGVEHVQELQVRCNGVPAEPAQVAVRSTPFDAMPPTPAAPRPAAEPLVPAESPPPSPPPHVPGRFTVEFEPATGPEGEAPAGPEPALVEIEVAFTLDGVPITQWQRLTYTPVEPIVLQWDREVVMVPKGKVSERVLSFSIASNRDADLVAPIRLSMGPGIRAVSTPGRLVLSPEHSDARVLVRATIDPGELFPDAGIEAGFKKHAARVRVLAVDVTVPDGLRVGLVRGPDDTVERALADLGVPFTALDRDALLMARLEDYGTVLLDMRAYYHRPELAEVRDRLLQFCRQGGRVVALYHKPNEWNERSGHPLLAPFAVTIGNDRVTEERSPVTMLLPEHPLWHRPHAITATDFDGWVQERGLNFPSQWDPAWSSLLALKDSGDDKPHTGALLHTQYGQGDFVLCSLALYRQLRIGNAGAARILVNLLAK